MKARTMGRIVALVFGFAVAFLFLGCKEKAQTVDLLAGGTAQGLMYKYDTGYTQGDDVVASIGVQKLWNCASAYCMAMHGAIRYQDASGAGGIPANYRESFRVEVCKGDLFMEMVNSVDRVSLSEQPESIPEDFLGDFIGFRVEDACNAPMSGNLAPTSIAFAPLETIDQRVEVRELAFRSYYAAIQGIRHFIENAADRQALYEAYGDSWFMDVDEENATGEALARQMFAFSRA